MTHKKQHIITAIAVLALVITTAGAFFVYKFRIFNPVEEYEPVLYIAQPGPGGFIIQESDPNCFTGQMHIFIATHGWIERQTWPEILALSINDKIDPDAWLCGWFDWRSQSEKINPTETARYAKGTAGPLLAKKILQLSTGFEHIHLLGHSAGSWAINEAARILARQTKATIHLTFLDAYVPPFWDQDELAGFRSDPNVSCWAEHYFTRDITLTVTQEHLSNAINIDLTYVTPGINIHRFPFYWYIATVRGKYDFDEHYIGEQLYYSADGIDYGFSRSLEAGQKNWQTSLAMPSNPEQVKLKSK